jgi:predicted permease
MRRLSRRLAYLLRSRQQDADLAEELELHRAMKQERLEQAGLPPDEAEMASRRALGNVTLAREDARGTWIWPWLESIWQDVRYALRTLRRQPGFTAVAVGTLAVAIGLNTAVFDVYSALTLRPWPVNDPDRVVKIFNLSNRDLRARAGGGPQGFSQAEMQYFSEHSKTMSGFLLMRSGGGDKTLGDDDVPASWVSGGYFSVLGVGMAAGRSFTPDEDRLESPAAVAVLSYGYWRRQFGGDPGVVGRTIPLEDVPFTVVGIAPAQFATSADRVDIWMPIASASLLRPEDRWVTGVAMQRENCCLQLAGRLAADTTPDQARAELAVLDRQFRAGRNTDAGGIRLAGTQHGGGIVSRFTPVFAGVTLVLVLACANVGNLLIARAAARRREIAVRLSIGASRLRVVRQLLTESLALALLAGGAGLVVAAWLARAFDRFMGSTALIYQRDTGVLAYALVLSVLSCIVFGLAPALHGTGRSIGNALRDGATFAGSRLTLRNLLLAIQVAVAIVLLVACGLLARAVGEVIGRDLGFPVRDVTVVTFELPPRGYDAARTRAVALQLAATINSGSSDGTVALASTEPLGSGFIKGGFRLAGAREDEFNSVFEVSPGYFDFMGLKVLSGRRLEDSDANRPVIVIGETMARRYWTIASAVGQRIYVDPATGGWNSPGELEIVGVVMDIPQTSLDTVDATIYQPVSGRILPRVLIRGPGDASVAAVTAAAARIDPRLRVRSRPLSANLASQVGTSRSGALIAGALGGLALMLATVGMIGVFSYWVQQRTREIGIRMALGARSLQVIRLVIRSSARALAAGAAAGVILAAGTSRLLRSYLFGVSTFDPLAYGAVLLLLVMVGALASYLPARRATRIDPVVALRHE